MLYRPAFAALIEAIAIDLSPVVLAGAITYLAYGSVHSWALAIMDVSAVLVSAAGLLSTALAFRRKLYIDDTHIAVVIGRKGYYLEWASVAGAVVRERRHLLTRTDRLLIVGALQATLTYNISVLSPEDEQAVIAQVADHTKLVVEQDAPAI